MAKRRGPLPGAHLSQLSQWRQWAGLTEKELAVKAGLSVAYIHKLEAGERGAYTAALTALATALEIDRTALVSFTPEQMGAHIYKAKLVRQVVSLVKELADLDLDVSTHQDASGGAYAALAS